MQAIVHYPKSETGMKALSKNLSAVHANGVINYIKRLNISKEQAEKLIEMIVRKAMTGE